MSHTLTQTIPLTDNGMKNENLELGRGEKGGRRFNRIARSPGPADIIASLCAMLALPACQSCDIFIYTAYIFTMYARFDFRHPKTFS